MVVRAAPKSVRTKCWGFIIIYMTKKKFGDTWPFHLQKTVSQLQKILFFRKTLEWMYIFGTLTLISILPHEFFWASLTDKHLTVDLWPGQRAASQSCWGGRKTPAQHPWWWRERWPAEERLLSHVTTATLVTLLFWYGLPVVYIKNRHLSPNSKTNSCDWPQRTYWLFGMETGVNNCLLMWKWIVHKP